MTKGSTDIASVTWALKRIERMTEDTGGVFFGVTPSIAEEPPGEELGPGADPISKDEVEADEFFTALEASGKASDMDEEAVQEIFAELAQKKRTWKQA